MNDRKKPTAGFWITVALIGKDYRESRHGYGLPRPLHHEVAAQNPGVRFL